MRIAVLGAGLTGVLSALELSESGHHVDLYDRADLPMTGASLNCEGKIHHGYVYALDQTLETARTMIRGAACFRELTARWVGDHFFEEHSSSPFTYAVPADSMLSVEQVRHHFASLSEYVEELDPLGGAPRERPAGWRQLDGRELSSMFDPTQVQAAFGTQEQAVDTEALAIALRAAVRQASRLTPRMRSEVLSLERTRSSIQVHGKAESSPFVESYDAVVNALWEQRLFIDATLGLDAGRPVMHRFKVGLFTRAPDIVQSLPSVTLILGSYGDTVGFRDNAYVSWYPAGLVHQECALRPSITTAVIDDDRRREIITRTIDNLQRLMPERAACLRDEPGLWILKGGFITAWGDSGIERRDSELHQRHAIGVHSSDNYHSIDTGKLTMAPLLAHTVTRRINAGVDRSPTSLLCRSRS